MRNISWCRCLNSWLNFDPWRNYATYFTVSDHLDYADAASLAKTWVKCWFTLTSMTCWNWKCSCLRLKAGSRVGSDGTVIQTLWAQAAQRHQCRWSRRCGSPWWRLGLYKHPVLLEHPVWPWPRPAQRCLAARTPLGSKLSCTTWRRWTLSTRCQKPQLRTD